MVYHLNATNLLLGLDLADNKYQFLGNKFLHEQLQLGQRQFVN
jgi:hypothetical protein